MGQWVSGGGGETPKTSVKLKPSHLDVLHSHIQVDLNWSHDTLANTLRG